MSKKNNVKISGQICSDGRFSLICKEKQSHVERSGSHPAFHTVS